MIRCVFFLIAFTCISFKLFTQVLSTIDFPQDSKWEIIEESTQNTSFEKIRLRKDWDTTKLTPVAFGKDVKVVWLKRDIRNPYNQVLDLRIITKGIDSLNVFEKDRGLVYQTGSHIRLSKRFLPSQFLVVPISLLPQSHKTIYIRVYNQAYHLGIPFLKIMNPYETGFFIKKKEIIYFVFMGSLLMMMLFSVIMLFFYREKLYIYYICSLICTFLIAFFYNDFLYFITEDLPDFVRNKNVFAIFLCLSNISYLLLSEQYFVIGRNKFQRLFWISRGNILLILLLNGVFLLSGEVLYNYRNLFYPLLSINSSITLYYLFVNISFKNIPAIFFMMATAPIVLVSLTDVTSDINGIPIQTLHDYFYFGSFVEMCFLFLGIVYRFKIERRSLEAIKKEVFKIEIDTKYQERDRIGREIHDSVGSQILQLSLYFDRIQNHLSLPEDFKAEYQKKVAALEETYTNLMKIPSSIVSQTLRNNDLLQEIRDLYSRHTLPFFKLSLPDSPLNLSFVTQEHIFRIITESVQNILKHANATEVGIDIMDSEAEFRLVIDDNGIGFEPDLIKKQGIGLKSMKYRAEEELKGSLTIESTPGNGTIVTFKVKKKNLPA